jgi:hypothetical protein
MTFGTTTRRSLGSVMFASLALAASAASCSTAEPTPPPDPRGYGAGAPTAGFASTGASGGMHGVSGAGGSSGGLQGGSAGSASATGGTGTGGGGAGGSASSGGSAGTLAAGGGAGTGNSSGGMSSGGTSGGIGFGFGGRVGNGGSGGTNNGGRGSGGMSSGGSSGSGGSGGGVAPPPNISNGAKGWASRYWDCCKPACGWSDHTGGSNPMKACDKSNNVLSDNNAKNACESGGNAYMCWDDAPWQVGDQLSYGFVAAPQDKFTCGRCYHLQFDGGNHNGGMQAAAASLNGKHMIVQVINNGGVMSDQFDLLIPGGGVGALNACTSTGNQLQGADLGAQYGGLLTECNGDVNCTRQKCQAAFAGKQGLLDGCNWFLGWYAGADNPSFTYQQIACPAELTNKSGLRDPG